ncbi:MAG: hypothetical protein AABX63_05065, partial [Nanoarchaeota archaeon]
MAEGQAGKTFKKSKAEFGKLHGEWVKYHEGKVVHPETGEEVSKADLRESEISDIVEKGYRDLQAKIGKKGRVLRREEIEPHIYEIAEKAYLAQTGVKDKKGVDKDILRQNAQQYFITIASRATGQQFETFEEAMQAVLEATNPIHGETDEEKSRILEGLLREYATLTHESKYEPTKGQKARRLRYLTAELSHPGHLPHLKGQYGDIFEQYGRSGHKFGPEVKSEHVLDVAQEAHQLDRIRGTTLRRKYIEGPDVIKEKPRYHKAA